MTSGTWEIVHRKEYGLPLGKTLGDAFKNLVANRFRHNAAKQIERIWDLDPHTAKNVVQKGSVSERTLTKAARSEGWAFWMALGEELFGESYSAWEEQRLTKIIEEAARDLDRVRRLRPAIEALSERSLTGVSTDPLESGEGSQLATSGEGQHRVRSAGGRASGEAQ
jgi:hypothetical protein